MFNNIKTYINYHSFFLIALIAKALNGLIEILGGISIFFIKPETINKFIIKITIHEISEDPEDIIANYLIKASSNISVNLQLFWFFYLLIHGIIKIFLVAMLFRKKLWAYPLAITVFSLFLIYQLYLYMNVHDPNLMILSIFDLFIIYLTWREYIGLKDHLISNPHLNL